MAFKVSDPTLPPGSYDFTRFHSYPPSSKTQLYPLVLSYLTHYPSYPLPYLLPYYLLLLYSLLLYLLKLLENELEKGEEERREKEDQSQRE